MQAYDVILAEQGQGSVKCWGGGDRGLQEKGGGLHARLARRRQQQRRPSRMCSVSNMRVCELGSKSMQGVLSLGVPRSKVALTNWFGASGWLGGCRVGCRGPPAALCMMGAERNDGVADLQDRCSLCLASLQELAVGRGSRVVCFGRKQRVWFIWR